MPGWEASVALEGGERNGSDSLTDAETDGKLSECRSVARGRVLSQTSCLCREMLEAETEPIVRVRTAARRRMKKARRRILLCAWSAAMALPAAGQAPAPAQVQTQAPPQAAPSPTARTGQRPAPQSAVTVDGSEAMFATMCALVAAGFESNVSAD